MTKVRHFPEQRKAILKALELIDNLPADNQWFFSISEIEDDAQLDIWVLPGEVEDFRRMLGLYDYECKETDYVTYIVDNLNVSIIEKGATL